MVSKRCVECLLSRRQRRIASRLPDAAGHCRRSAGLVFAWITSEPPAANQCRNRAVRVAAKRPATRRPPSAVTTCRSRSAGLRATLIPPLDGTKSTVDEPYSMPLTLFFADVQVCDTPVNGTQAKSFTWLGRRCGSTIADKTIRDNRFVYRTWHSHSTHSERSEGFQGPKRPTRAGDFGDAHP
jgi:hypothetical protein